MAAKHEQRIRRILGAVDDDLLEEMRIWRVIEAGIATLRDMERYWSVDDLLRATAYLDVKSEIEKVIMEK